MSRGATDPHVLIVDGNADGRDLYATAVRLAGLKAWTAVASADALSHARTHRPRAIVADLRLPGEDGARLIEALRQDTRTADMYIVALSAAPEADRARAVSVGCDTFLPKPCLPDTLVNELRRAFAKPDS